MRESNQKLINTVSEKHQLVKDQVIKTLNTLVGKSDSEKVNQTKILHDQSITLKSILADSDIPHWLRTLERESFIFISNNQNPANLLKQIIALHPDIMNYQWDFNQEDSVVYNVDDIYEGVTKELDIEQTFDDLIEKLKLIIDSGDVDSRGAMESLIQLQSLIIQNKDSSFLGLSAVVNFGRMFFVHPNWQVIIDDLNSKEFAKDAEESFHDLEEKQIQSLINVRAEIGSRFNSGISKVTNKTKYKVNTALNDDVNNVLDAKQEK